MNIKEVELIQREVCEVYQASYFPAPLDMKVGISLNVKEKVFPLNGLRHPPEGDTTGWYIWAGEELLETDDFFEPLHVDHIRDWCPQVYKFLGLPPGWRFLIAEGYEDVWYDPSLLDIE